MKTDFNFENAKVGDKVYHVSWGWVEVTDNDGSAFEIQDEYWYNYNGKFIDSNENPTIYPYNPFDQNQERVVKVLDDNQGWIKRKLITELPMNKVVCWNENMTQVFLWSKWREIQPQKELTQEEKINILWEKYGKGFCNDNILIQK